ncbi:MAG: hypothetical protein OK422_01835 [Thaumarchaeota archaeon]|nr:hypothetical protein [Nitrososphaerota archaeon]
MVISTAALEPQERGEARALGRELLNADDAILGIIITNEKGRALVYLGKQGSSTKVVVDEREIKRIGVVEFMALKMAPRPGQDTGKSEYVMFVYEKFKILVTELKKPRLVIGLKLTRSSNVEYIMHKVLKKYRWLAQNSILLKFPEIPSEPD